MRGPNLNFKRQRFLFGDCHGMNADGKVSLGAERRIFTTDCFAPLAMTTDVKLLVRFTKNLVSCVFLYQSHLRTSSIIF